MKIYNRKEFLQLPEGTIFCKGVKWCFDNMSIKGNSWDDDFLYVDLCYIDAQDTGQWVDRLEDSLKNGTSYPINNNTARDGLFDECSIFLVFENKDLEFLIKVMKNAIRIVTPPSGTVTKLKESV
jgi:hypothetical protein